MLLILQCGHTADFSEFMQDTPVKGIYVLRHGAVKMERLVKFLFWCIFLPGKIYLKSILIFRVCYGLSVVKMERHDIIQ